MTAVNKSLNKSYPEQELRIAVTLPGYHTRGMPHGVIQVQANVTGDTLSVDLFVYAENLKCPGFYRGTFSAADLGLAPNRRTGEQVATNQRKED